MKIIKIFVLLAGVLLLTISCGHVEFQGTKVKKSYLELAEKFLARAEGLYEIGEYHSAEEYLHDAEWCITKVLNDEAGWKHGIQDRIQAFRNDLDIEFAILYLDEAVEAIRIGKLEMGIISLEIARGYAKKIQVPKTAEEDSLLRDINDLEKMARRLLDEQMYKYDRDLEEYDYFPKLIWTKV